MRMTKVLIVLVAVLPGFARADASKVCANQLSVCGKKAGNDNKYWENCEVARARAVSACGVYLTTKKAMSEVSCEQFKKNEKFKASCEDLGRRLSQNVSLFDALASSSVAMFETAQAEPKARPSLEPALQGNEKALDDAAKKGGLLETLVGAALVAAGIAPIAGLVAFVAGLVQEFLNILAGEKGVDAGELVNGIGQAVAPIVDKVFPGKEKNAAPGLPDSNTGIIPSKEIEKLKVPAKLSNVTIKITSKKGATIEMHFDAGAWKSASTDQAGGSDQAPTQAPKN